MITVRAMNAVNGESWMDLFLNPERISYVHKIQEGEFKDHYIAGFDFREFIINKDNIKDLFEI